MDPRLDEGNASQDPLAARYASLAGARLPTRLRGAVPEDLKRAVSALNAGSSARLAARWGHVLRVAQFELHEALRSKLFVFVLVLFGAGAGIASHLFLSALAAAETRAREAVAAATGVGVERVPEDLVRVELGRFLSQFVENQELAQQLVRIQPLAVFHGFVSLNLVALLVLIVSSGAIAGDLQSGAVRFILPRCDRRAWTLGKALGQALLLATGLGVGALVAGLVGQAEASHFGASGWLWLGIMSLRTWFYGMAYLGLFLGLSQLVRSALGARALALLFLIGCALGHSILSAPFVQEHLPFAAWLGWLFPANYKAALWSPSLPEQVGAAVALLAIGAVGFALGQAVFQRKDA